MLNYRKTMLGVSLLALIGVWMGCSSDTSPVASYSASKSHTAAHSQIVDIPDANLASAIRTALGRPASDATSRISTADLRSLTTLRAGGRGIVNLTGLEYATNLDTLSLNHNKITDISPLEDLTGLKYLDLYANYTIPSISPLAGLINLEWLAVGGNPLNGNVGPLAGLTKLKLLRVHATGLGDSGLKTLAHALTDLEHLNISKSGRITDFSPLTCLENLEVLVLRNMGRRLYITNLAGFREPKPLALFYLAANGVTLVWD